MRHVPDNTVRENQNTLYALYGFSKIVSFVRYCGKYGRVWQATDGNMAHPLDSGYQRLQTHTQNM
jgi:hypothetical protein